MAPCRRRRYHSLRDVGRDLQQIAARRRDLRAGLLSPALRERLLMVVTQVNQCRYCSFVHSRLALRAGIAPAEVQALLAGALPGDVPAGESTALLYAQHWAESDALPTCEALARLQDVYGHEKAGAINAILHVIRMANLAGNTWDCLLFRLSGGRLGR